MTTTQTTDVKFYVLKPVHELTIEERKNTVTTAAFRMCTLCNHPVDSSGGPGIIQFCPECVLLFKNGYVKMERTEDYNKAVLQLSKKELVNA